MYSKLCKGSAWLIMVLIFSNLFSIAQAQQIDAISHSNKLGGVVFSAKPANCVALHQGRKCYAIATLIWQTPIAGDFCISEKVTNKVLQCWKNTKSSILKVEFESSSKVEYQLVKIEKNQVIAEAEISVSWVHKASPRKRRWRLF